MRSLYALKQRPLLPDRLAAQPRSLEVGACPRDFMIGRPGDIETRRHDTQHSHTACPVARRGMGSLRGMK